MSTDASTQWSEYVWDSQSQKWVSSRRNARGKVEYQYHDPDPKLTTTSQAVPRSFGQTADDSRATVATTAYTLTPIAGSGRGTSPIYSVPATAVYAPTSLNNPVASSYDTNAATSFSTEAGDSQPIALAQTSSPVRSDSAGSKPEYPWTQYGVYTSSTIGYPSTREDSDAPDNVANDLGGVEFA
jgi:hypothetical protein